MKKYFLFIFLFFNSFCFSQEIIGNWKFDFILPDTIQTGENDGRIQLQIKDNGVGISENVRPKIFERYFTTKDIGEGTGQGLAFVYEVVVTQLGGNIDVKSIVGKGTTFMINFPI